MHALWVENLRWGDKYHKTNWQTHYRNKLWILPSLVNLKMHMWPLITIMNALEPNKPKGICDHYYQLNSNDIENTEIGTNVRIRIIMDTQWLSIWLLVSNTKLHCVTTALQSCQLNGSVYTADESPLWHIACRHNQWVNTQLSGNNTVKWQRYAICLTTWFNKCYYPSPNMLPSMRARCLAVRVNPPMRHHSFIHTREN